MNQQKPPMICSKELMGVPACVVAPGARSLLRRWVIALSLTALASGPVMAGVPFWGDRITQPAEVPAERLQQGQWVWAPGLSPRGPILVVVNLDQQLAYAYRNAVLVGYTSVSTGKKGYQTPTGVFHTLQKDKHHRSSIYNNAPMPYTQRLTWGGVALHAGGLPGYPSSHGCVHLPSGFAEELFNVSPMGMTVVVAKNGSAPLDLQHPLPISPIDPRTGTVEHEPRLGTRESFRWNPGNAPEGPLALVVSRADERILVLRGGVEIGRARVTLTEPARPFGTHAFVAKMPDPGQQGGTRWVGVAVPGHAEDAGRALDAKAVARVRLPAGFLARLQPILAEGTTLVVTDAPILPQTTGTKITVVTNQPPEQ
jgi:hypothetical protein